MPAGPTEDGGAAGPALTAAAAAVRRCTKCGLCECRENAVPGAGAAGARALFVGEAPGRTEDARGEPFAGAAGRRLDEALLCAGLTRGSVYVTNVVKCRPPGNRAPAPGERAACAPHLEAEMALVDPAVVCVMGNTAFSSLLGGGRITSHRGRVIRRGGRAYVPTVHPAATIYNRGLLPLLKRDVRKVARMAGARA